MPQILAHFQERTITKGGWTRCEDPDSQGQGYEATAISDVTKVEVGDMYVQRVSLTESSSRKTIHTQSEKSLDTPTMRTANMLAQMPRRESDGSIWTPMTPLDGRMERQRVQTAGKPYNLQRTDSFHSTVSSPSRPSTANRRIAFAPSVRIANSVPPKPTATVRKSQAEVKSYFEDDKGDEADSSSARSPLVLPNGGRLQSKKPPFLAKGVARTREPVRPSTAPSLPSRGGAAFAKSLFRPLSRGRQEGGERSELQHKAAEGTALSRRDSLRSVHAPLHPGGPFGPSEPASKTDPLQATRVQKLPSPPRSFYPGTLILVKDGPDEGGSPPFLDAHRQSEPRRESQERNDQAPPASAFKEAGTLWHGTPWQPRMGERRGFKKLRRAVDKLSAVLSFRSGPSGKVLEDVDFNTPVHSRSSEATTVREWSAPPPEPPLSLPQHVQRATLPSQGTKHADRPSTAPSHVSTPRWGTPGLHRTARIVSREEGDANNSTLLIASKERERLDSLRDLEEIRKRATIWDQASRPSTAKYPPSATQPVSHPGWQRRASEQDLPSRVFTGQMASLAPVSRVSIEQLRKMKPLKVVRTPAVH